jgi:hypothetical protein
MAEDPSPELEARERIEKLRLEKQVLQRQLKRSSLWLEWAKAIAGPVAIGGLITTIILGYVQINQNHKTRDDERFERAVSRVGAAQVSERLTGIAGLQQFLDSKDPARQANSLQYLVNAAVIESDPTVRSAIVDIFVGLSKTRTSQGALQIALVSARDRNRAILRRYQDAFLATYCAAYVIPTRLCLIPKGNRPVGLESTEVPIGQLTAEQQAPLEVTASIIAALVRAGARIDDLSHIYCVECAFGLEDQSVNLANVKFDLSFLRRANFRNSNLAGSSFHNADLVQTWFTNADLRGAKLTADVPAEPWTLAAALASGQLLNIFGADFECADLTDADFAGRAVFSFIYKNPTFAWHQNDQFRKANLRRTNLVGFQYLLGFPQELVRSVKPDPAFFFYSQRFFPATRGQWSGPSDSVNAIGGKTYVLWTVSTNDDFRFTGPIDPAFVNDVYMAFRNLHSARNLSEARMPPGLKQFMEANDKQFSVPPPSDPGCQGRAN